MSARQSFQGSARPRAAVRARVRTGRAALERAWPYVAAMVVFGLQVAGTVLVVASFALAARSP
jgi:hypothetical protein